MKGVPRPSGARDAGDQSERERLRRVYDAYDADPYYQKIWSDGVSRYIAERKWELIAALVRREGIDVPSAWILALGAGDGKDCARLRDLGASPDRIIALDLLAGYARRVRHSYDWMAPVVADAGWLPFDGECFDLIYQSTMMSSVLDAGRRLRILEEVRRVLRPRGAFLSYDVRYPNPRNRHTRPVKAAELARAFAGWHVRTWSTTGLPQLLRLLAPLSLRACRVIERIPPLRSHLLVLARKP